MNGFRAQSNRLVQALGVLAALILSVSAAHAMVYGDSKILDRAGMRELGVDITARDNPGPVAGFLVTVSTARTGGPPRFESMSCIVLRGSFDAAAAIADAKQRGFVVATKWGHEERRETSRELNWTFEVSAAEVARSYLIVRLNLPPKNGVPVFGTYFFLLRDVPKS